LGASLIILPGFVIRRGALPLIDKVTQVRVYF
jgi:hypothetical protein